MELRETLAPEVAKWHSFHLLQAEVGRRRTALLRRKEGLLQSQVEGGQRQVAKLQRGLERAQAAGRAAVQDVAEAQAGYDGLMRSQREAEAECMAACKQVGAKLHAKMHMPGHPRAYVLPYQWGLIHRGERRCGWFV